MTEMWKNVVGYEGIYEVSNLGKIRTKEGKQTKTKRHGIRTWKQRELKQKTDKNGYKRVGLWKDGKEKTHLVHRIVAEVFLEKIPEKEIINHKNGNPNDNRVENIEWCNYRENLEHAYDNRLNEEAHPIILFNIKTKEIKYFNSKSKASFFLGKNHGYISNLLMKKKSKVGNYEIFTKIS